MRIPAGDNSDTCSIFTIENVDNQTTGNSGGENVDNQTTGNSGDEHTEKNIQENDTDKKDAVPKTGDSTPVVWLLVLLSIAGTGLVLAGKKVKSY